MKKTTGELQNQVAELTQAQDDLMLRHVQLEEQNAMLATLYVALQSLHKSLKQADVLLSVREIVANLIGCEQYALFMLQSDVFRLVDSFGIDPDECAGTVMGRVTNAVQTGEPYWAEDIDGIGATGLTACIPLRRHGAVTGVLVLFRLLPQKFELHETDRELLRLLEAQLAMALYCAELHEKRIVTNEVAP